MSLEVRAGNKVSLAAMHQEVEQIAVANLRVAASAWRVGQGLPSLRDAASNASTAARKARTIALPDNVPPQSLASVVVHPQRTTRADAEREATTIATAEADAPAILTRYHVQFGWIYNADNMSELLGVHGDTERWQHHDAVRSAASALTQTAFDWAMSHPVHDADATVIFTGGGNGSGKSAAIGAGVVGVGLDSTLSDVDSSARNIETALRSGRTVAIAFIYRPPLDAFLHGVVPRALDPRNGRAVTIHTHALTHLRAPRTLLALADRYAHDPRVSVRVIENVTGAAAVLRDVGWLRRVCADELDFEALAPRLADLVDQQVAANHRTRFTG